MLPSRVSTEMLPVVLQPCFSIVKYKTKQVFVTDKVMCKSVQVTWLLILRFLHLDGGVVCGLFVNGYAS